MLKDLCRYNNLGTPLIIFSLLDFLKENKDSLFRRSDVNQYFYNKSIDGVSIFEGCIPFLETIKIISFNDKNHLLLDERFLTHLRNMGNMRTKLVERFFMEFSNDEVLLNIFSSEFISYDIIYKSIQLDNSAFKFKYSSLKQFLLDFGVIMPHPTKSLNKYLLNSHYKKIFDKIILPEIKKGKIGIEEFKRSMEMKQIYGEEAEKYVLSFESKRLNGRKEIDWVAEYSVSEGYDVASFESEDSIENDRFIEVKSYAGDPYFFWSRNEMDVARIKGVKYYLYLVNRDMYKDDDYSPLIIRNPYLYLRKSNSNWDQTIEKIRFELNEEDIESEF